MSKQKNREEMCEKEGKKWNAESVQSNLCQQWWSERIFGVLLVVDVSGRLWIMNFKLWFLSYLRKFNSISYVHKRDF